MTRKVYVFYFSISSRTYRHACNDKQSCRSVVGITFSDLLPVLPVENNTKRNSLQNINVPKMSINLICFRSKNTYHYCRRTVKRNGFNCGCFENETNV